MSTDDEWEAWGQRDPYFGVLTHDRFRADVLDENAKADFFASGEADIAGALSIVHRHIDSTFAPRRAVDFGCGVGRLLVPLAQRCDEVVGVDVSSSMLAEARRNCEERGITNAKFVESDDALTQLSGTFDFVHSMIVFQHIPSRRAAAIFKSLVDHLADGGVGAVHVVYGERRPEVQDRQAIASEVAKRLRATPVWQIARKRLRNDPEIQMNAIDLNRIFATLDSADVSSSHVTFRQHGQYLAATIYFQRGAAR